MTVTHRGVDDRAGVSASGTLTRRHRPTALFTDADSTLIGALWAAEEVGTTVPTQPSAVGYDASRSSSRPPAPTRVRVPRQAAGVT